MFISSKEKNEMQLAIRRLQAEVRDLSILIAKQNAQPIVEKKRPGYKWTDEDKKAASERMKKKWADRKSTKEST